ncbi:hypothetical protein CI610_00016 [invertebrate metagenome]|uniref:Uncharacterized protein n=1 Tax=invertebrate metagenome TaxID=1711999 RepID=A0A2H9TCP7_9ZZZZ
MAAFYIHAFEIKSYERLFPEIIVHIKNAHSVKDIYGWKVTDSSDIDWLAIDRTDLKDSVVEYYRKFIGEMASLNQLKMKSLMSWIIGVLRFWVIFL